MWRLSLIPSIMMSTLALGQEVEKSFVLIPHAGTSHGAGVAFMESNGIDDDSYRLVSSHQEGQSTLRFVTIQLTVQDSIRISSGERFNALFSSLESDPVGELSSCGQVNDPGFPLQWGLDNDGSFNNAIPGADVSACQAWTVTTGSSSVTVGFVDSGVKLTHSDLSGRLWTNPNEIPSNGIDDDQNGYVDDVRGWNTAEDNNDLTDAIGHGTQINGIVGANPGNGNGFVGLDWSCRLMNVKGVNNSGQGLLSWWAEGVYYLVDNGADIINLSLTAYSHSSVLESAVQYAESNGVLVVAAVGNDDLNTIGYPAKYPTVLAVGATNYADQRAVWGAGAGSNYGPEVDVVAPGQTIYGINHVDNSLSYVTAGTSQATPLAAATASLLLSVSPSSSPGQLRGLIRNSAEDQVGLSFEDVPGHDEHHGYGRLNAFAALSLVQNPSRLDEYELDVKVEHDSYSGGISIFSNHSTRVRLKIFAFDGRAILTEELSWGERKNFNLNAGSIILRIEDESGRHRTERLVTIK